MSNFGSTMNRPPSGARPGSGVRGTSWGQAQPVAGVGQSLTREVEVTARPAVMREGMKAMNMPTRSGVGTSAGPGRQVVDRSYYIGLLRPKIAELTAEIERLKQQEDQINRNSATLGQLQQKHKSLTDEIQALKATMSDVNFAVERAASQDAETINGQAMQLRQSNADLRRQVDKLFLGVKEVDAQTRNSSSVLDQDLRNLETRLMQDNNADFARYKAARDESFRVSDAVLQQMHEVRSLGAKQELLLNSLAQDADKKRGATYLLEILKKRQQRDEMAKECSLSVDQEKQMLIKQAKTTRDDNEILERQVADARDAIQETKNRIDAANEELKNYSGDNARVFQEMQEKDREMQEFIDGYAAKEREELANIQQVERSIVEVLERISRAHLLKQQMPQDSTPKMLQQLSEELGEKETQLQNAKVTHQRLEKELLERKEELAKVQHLDEKITMELQSHAQKMQEQRQDIVRYSDIDALRQEIEQRRKSLTSRKAYLTRVRDNSKQLVHMLSAQFESKKQRLNDNDVHTSLAAQEQKMRLIWQSAFALEEFVRMKEKETQYMSTKAECMRIADECNSMLKDPKRFEKQQGSSVTMLIGK